MKEKELKVVALKNGTVIDHIPSDKLFKVVSILKLDEVKNQLTFGNNLESRKLGTKGIVKVSDLFFTQSVIDKIALIAPCAKLNIIKNYVVVEKKSVHLSEEITDIVCCANPKCITNNQPVPTKFQVINKEPVTLRCCYCEKVFREDELKIK
ncbi:MAG: aspartate carbamoyltransferase regulatory subunit [Prevotellaceae bacterium]|jgi:aspartate carbamoyltransferase regulatory subunit|nr:aspartate carbamoyltransferase regulatory subunit [Prevotellaceae bacterium]